VSENIKVVQAEFGKRAPKDLSKCLREIADAVDRGEIVSLVAAYVDNGEYQMMFGASLTEGLTLSTLLHRRSVDGFFK